MSESERELITQFLRWLSAEQPLKKPIKQILDEWEVFKARIKHEADNEAL